MPVEMLSLVRPELLRVLQAVPQDIILDMAVFTRHCEIWGEDTIGVDGDLV